MKKSACLVARKEEANNTIRKLLDNGQINKALRIRKDGDNILIPVMLSRFKREDRPVISYELFKSRDNHTAPQKKIKAALKRKKIMEEIPEKWVRLGSALFFRELKGKNKVEVAKTMAKVLKVESVYAISGRIHGKMRYPTVSLVAGNGGEIVHLENGVRFLFDPEKIMFSPGNVNERTLESYIDATEKVVWDMFSGIGYFSIPIAKYGNPRIAYCTDINPVAIEYLRKNAALNHVKDKIVPVNLDCRDFVPEFSPDLIIMGNFDSMSYLDKVQLSAGRNAMIVIHHLMSSGTERDQLKVEEKFHFAVKRKFRIVGHRVVKSYSPKRWHVVTTILFDD